MRCFPTPAALAVAVAVAVICAAGPAIAQSATPPAAASGSAPASSNQPLTIDASKGIEWRRDERVYIATGNAKAVRGTMTLLADQLKAFYRDKPSDPAKQGEDALGGSSDIYRVEAIDNVVIHTETEMVVGEKAVYDLDRAVIVVTGRNLRMNTASNQSLTARDSLEYYDKTRVTVARGDAVAVQPGRRISADILTGHLEKDAKTGDSRMEKVDAFGNVRITTPKQIASGAKGVYNLDKNFATLVGDVRVTSGQNQLEGDYGEVDLNTGVSRMLSGDAAGRAGSRVRGLLVPKEAEAPTADPAGKPRS